MEWKSWCAAVVFCILLPNLVNILRKLCRQITDFTKRNNQHTSSCRVINQTYLSLDKSISIVTTVDRSDKWLLFKACSCASTTACWTCRLSTKASVICAHVWAACMRYSPMSLTRFCDCSGEGEEADEEEGDSCLAIVWEVTWRCWRRVRSCCADCVSYWVRITGAVFGVVIDLCRTGEAIQVR